MTNPAENAVEMAQIDYDEAVAKVKQQNALLGSSVAAQVTQRVDDWGRALAKKEPDLARQLGAVRLKEFRDQLWVHASRIADAVRGGFVEKPDRLNSSLGSSSFHVEQSIRDALPADSIQALWDTAREYGFDAGYARNLDFLFDTNNPLISDLNVAINARDRLGAVLDRARKAHDDAEIDDLWGN